MTKEEIYGSSWNNGDQLDLPHTYQAMDEYAKQEAIAFGIWLSSHHLNFQPAANGEWIGLNMERISNKDLYEEYLKSKP